MIGTSYNIGLRWLPAEDDHLRQRWNADSLESLCMRLGRTEDGVISRAKRIGLWGDKAGERRRRLADRRERVAAMIRGGATQRAVAAVLGASQSAIGADVQVLGLGGARRVRCQRIVSAVRARYRVVSANALAKELKVTRNVVIGTARDLGLCRRRAER